jgi:predicted ATP-dependent endonuclease of OLD family
LNDRVRAAIAAVSRADRRHFGEVPVRILDALTRGSSEAQNIQSILSEIERLSERFQRYPIHVESISGRLYRSVQAVPKDQENARVAAVVLNAYLQALRNIVMIQEGAFERIEKYLATVNSFLQGKALVVTTRSVASRGAPSVELVLKSQNPADTRLHAALSSGERQIVTLIWASSTMTEEQVILIDEPEISLHVDWQRRLLPAMVEQMPTKQLIVCTHSPVIGAGYPTRMQELLPKPTTDVAPDAPDLFDSEASPELSG